MQVKNQKSYVNVSDDVQSKGFGIVFDRHMVNILSNQLYQDKVLAIVRELSTNAYDSHVENGNHDVPFDVHLPSWVDCNFVIRDYGTGMSPEKVDSIYRHYGATNRNQSNDFTGCMGLGSKSPFCYYTKTFTVETWYDGIHYTYACHLNQDGMPQISKLSEVESDEPSGVKISIPCQHYDRYKFYDAANKVYPYFNTFPNIVGNDYDSKQYEKISKKTYDVENERGWKYDNHSLYSKRKMQIVMGNVVYPVDYTQFSDWPNVHRHILNSGFDVYVDIGEVDVTSSRESLEYTNRTKVHIRKYVNDIISSFYKTVSEDITEKCKSLWEARLYFANTYGTIASFCDHSKIYFNDKKLFTHSSNGIFLYDFVDNQKIKVCVIKSNRYGNRKKVFQTFISYGTTTLILRSGNMELYEDNLKTGAYSRAKRLSKETNCNILLIKFKDPNSIQEVCDRLGCKYEDFKKISSIPSKNRTTTSPRGSISDVVKFIPGKLYVAKSHFWENCQIDINNGGYYVEFNRFNYKLLSSQNMHIPPRELSNLCRKLSNIGVQIPTIYGIKTKNIDKISKMHNWESFYDFIVLKLYNLTKTYDLDYLSKICDTIAKVDRDLYGNIRLNISNMIKVGIDCCDTRTDFYKLAKTVRDLKDERDKYDIVVCQNYKIIKDLCIRFDIKIKDTDKHIPNVDKMLIKVIGKYKLIRHINSQCFSQNDLASHVGRYINSLG